MKNPPLETLKEIPIRRDGMTEAEADELIQEVRALVEDGADPEEILLFEFGLEPDYIFDLI